MTRRFCCIKCQATEMSIPNFRGESGPLCMTCFLLPEVKKPAREPAKAEAVPPVKEPEKTEKPEKPKKKRGWFK